MNPRLMHKVRDYFTWGIVEPRYLFILSSLRSGSSLLASYLESTQQVAWKGEILHQHNPANKTTRWLRHVPPLRRQRAFSIARRVLHKERLNLSLRAAKLHREHMERCQIRLEHVEQAFPTAQYILIYRESILAQFVSLKVARASQRFSRRKSDADLSARGVACIRRAGGRVAG